MTTLNPSRPAISQQARPAAPPSAAPGSAPVIDPLKLLQKYKWLLGIAAAVGLALGAVGHYVLLYTYPIYRTSVIFETFPIETDPAVIGNPTGVKDEFDAFKSTQVHILLSDLTIESTVSDPRLQIEAPKWTSQFMNAGSFDRVKAATRLRRNLSAGIMGDSNLVRMSFWWTDPEEAVAVARIVRRVYLDGRREMAGRDISQRKDLLLAAIRQADEDIRSRQRDRERLLQTQSVDALESATTAANNQLKAIDEKLIEIRMDKENLRTQLAQLERELASPVGINYSDSIRKRVDDDPIIANQRHAINVAEARISAARLRLGAEHRSLRQMETELESMRQVLAETTQKLRQQAFDAQLDGLRNAIRSMDAQEADQLRSHEIATRKATELTQIRTQIGDIDLEISRLQDSKAKFSNDLKNIEVTTQGRNQARVMLYQDAMRPRAVTFPRLIIMVPLGIILVIGLVGGVVVLIEVIDQRVKSPSDIAMIPRTRVLGIIPHSSEDPANPSRIETVFRDQPGGVMAEHIRQLRGSIIKRMQQGNHKSLVVMSGMPDSGATTVTMNLALALAAAEHRVLLVDANFRRPALHRILGLKEAPGLADVLAGSRTLADCAQRTDNERLTILAAGSPDNRMFERLGTEAMGNLLKEAGEQYDLILIDVAPAMVSGDALSVANRADASLLVVRALGEKRGMVARLRNDLGDARGEFLGVVVNAVRSAAGGYLRGNILATHRYRNSQAS